MSSTQAVCVWTGLSVVASRDVVADHGVLSETRLAAIESRVNRDWLPSSRSGQGVPSEPRLAAIERAGGGEEWVARSGGRVQSVVVGLEPVLFARAEFSGSGVMACLICPAPGLHLSTTSIAYCFGAVAHVTPCKRQVSRSESSCRCPGEIQRGVAPRSLFAQVAALLRWVPS